MQRRILQMEAAQIRSSDSGRYLEGYFAVFDREYQVCPGWVETIAPGAFVLHLSSGADVKILWNHDPNIVLGSTGNHTASLREDEKGLWGSVLLNERDQDAVNAYARVERGDVTGCSFGFEIARQEDWWDDAGVYHTRILEVSPLYEVSPCTFPAYVDTSITARNRENLESARAKLAEKQQEKRTQWRQEMLRRLKGEPNGT